MSAKRPGLLHKFMVMMQTAPAIFFLLLITITQTPLGELVKLPVLIEHFNKHQKNEGISLLKFLGDHYSKEHDDSDQAEDKQLPFKTVLLQPVGVAILPGIIDPDAAGNFEIPIQLMFSEVYTSQQHLCSIFHPPRI